MGSYTAPDRPTEGPAQAAVHPPSSVTAPVGCAAATGTSAQEAQAWGPATPTAPGIAYKKHVTARQVAAALSAAGMLGHPLTAPAVAWGMLQGLLDSKDPAGQR